MRITSLFVAAALVLQVVACSSGTTGTGGGAGTSGGSSGGTSGSTSSSGGGGANGAATCDSACAYYLQCKGTDSTETRANCNQQCAATNNTAEQLLYPQTLDCPAAIKWVEEGGSSSSSSSSSTSSSSSSGPGSNSSCSGCVWDGSSCIYLTGSGGNYFPCETSCCK